MICRLPESLPFWLHYQRQASAACTRSAPGGQEQRPSVIPGPSRSPFADLNANVTGLAPVISRSRREYGQEVLSWPVFGLSARILHCIFTAVKRTRLLTEDRCLVKDKIFPHGAEKRVRRGQEWGQWHGTNEGPVIIQRSALIRFALGGKGNADHRL